MSHIFISSILTDNTEAIKYVVVALLALSVLTMIVKKVFKLALILALITIAAYYAVPGLISTPPLH